MGGMFSTPKVPQVAPLETSVPTIADDAVLNAQRAEIERLQKQKGRAATILSQKSGDDATLGSSRKGLLGN